VPLQGASRDPAPARRHAPPVPRRVLHLPRCHGVHRSRPALAAVRLAVTSHSPAPGAIPRAPPPGPASTLEPPLSALATQNDHLPATTEMTSMLAVISDRT